MAKKVPEVNLSDYVRYVIGDICKGKLKMGEIVVLTTYIGGQIIVSVYPRDANYENAVKLLTTSLMQTQTSWKIRAAGKEEEKAKVIRKQYTM